MKALPVLVFFFVGCASTKIYKLGTDHKYHLVCAIQSNAVNVNYQEGNLKFHADSIDNSTPTQAQGAAAEKVIGAAGSTIGAASAFFLLKK